MYFSRKSRLAPRPPVKRPVSKPRKPRSQLSRVESLLRIAVSFAAAAVLNDMVAEWTERRHPPTGKFVTVRGIRLHYLDLGPTNATGSPVVLLHGNGATSEDFVVSGLTDLLARDRRVIVFDRPGFGHSERPRSALWTPGAQARLLSEALTLIGIERPIVAGHSWGTMVALALALRMPHGLSGLVLISGYYFPSVRGDVPLFSLPAIPGTGDVLRYSIAPLLGWLMAPAIVRKLFAPSAVPESFGEFPLSMSLRPSQIRASAADTAMMIPAAAALSLRYDGIKMPVAVLSGDGDQIVRVDQSRRLHQKIPGSELHEIRHAGHMAHHLEPETIAAAIDAVERTGRVGRCSVLTAIRIRERARTLWKDAGRPSDGVATFRDVAASEIAGEELAYDKALADSFPASDPPANSGFTR